MSDEFLLLSEFIYEKQDGYIICGKLSGSRRGASQLLA